MIKIDSNKNLIVTDDDLFIGYTGDNLNVTKEILIENETDISLIYRMYLKFDDGTCNFFLLDKTETDNGTKLIWKITSDQIYKDGIVKVQIKASNSSGEVFHTNSINMLVQSSIEFCDSFAEKKVAEYLQHEEHLNEIVRKGQEIYDYFLHFEVDDEPTENSGKLISSGAVYNALLSKANFKNINYHYPNALNTARGTDAIYNVYFKIDCNNVAQGTRGILFATDENTQILITDSGNIFYRNYNLTENVWGDFTSIISELNDTVEREQNKRISFEQGYDQQVKQFNNAIQLLEKTKISTVECRTDLTECNNENIIYYLPVGIRSVFGKKISDGAEYIGYVIYRDLIDIYESYWLMFSYGGKHKGIYKIDAKGNITPIADTQVTENSDNIITSGAVYNALDELNRTKVSTVNGNAPDENGNVDLIVESGYPIDLSECRNENIIYYRTGIKSVFGREISDGAEYNGYVIYRNLIVTSESYWLMFSHNGKHKGIYKIDAEGNITPIADTQVTENSNNIITSGAVYNALDELNRTKVSTVNGNAPDENGNVDLIVESGYPIDLSECRNENIIYYCPEGIRSVCGIMISDGAEYKGYVIYVDNLITSEERYWVMFSYGGKHKGIYKIDEHSNITPIADTQVTENSNNIITSGAVYNALDELNRTKISTVNGNAPDENGNVDLIVECNIGTDLSECTDTSKLYYFYRGINTLNGNLIGDLYGAGITIGFVKRCKYGWLFISSGEGQTKSNLRITDGGVVQFIGSTDDYSDLNNKPAINDVELTGNKTLEELGLYNKEQVDEIIANQSISGSGSLNITTQSVIDSNAISSATYYYVKQGEVITLFCSIKFNQSTCGYVGFNGLPFTYNNKAGQLRNCTASSKSDIFRVSVSGSMLYISSSATARTQDEELNFSITYLV